MDGMIRPNLGKKGEGAQGIEATSRNTQKGQGARDLLQEYHRGTRQAEIDAKEKSARDVLTAEELAQFPEDIRGEVEKLYNGHLSKVFQQEGVKVTPKDPEWMYIQVELEDPTSTLSRTMIAAKEAAQQKKQRLQGMTRGQIWDQVNAEHKQAAEKQAAERKQKSRE